MPKAIIWSNMCHKLMKIIKCIFDLFDKSVVKRGPFKDLNRNDGMEFKRSLSVFIALI